MTLSANRRHLMAILLASPLAPVISLLDAEAKSKSGKRRRKKKKKQARLRVAACLASEPQQRCAPQGCVSSDQSPECAACFAGVAECCRQLMTSTAAQCACIDAMPKFCCPCGA